MARAIELSSLSIGRLLDYRKEILASLIVVASALAYYQLIYSRGREELKRLDSQIEGVKQEIERVSLEVQQNQQIAERLEEVMTNLKQLEERFLITQSKLPSDTQISSVLKGLTSDEMKKTIKFTSIRPLPIEDKKEYFRLPFQITLQSRFQAFGEYMERLEEMPRIVSVENFRVEGKEGEPYLTVQLYASTYVLSGQ